MPPELLQLFLKYQELESIDPDLLDFLDASQKLQMQQMLKIIGKEVQKQSPALAQVAAVGQRRIASPGAPDIGDKDINIPTTVILEISVRPDQFVLYDSSGILINQWTYKNIEQEYSIVQYVQNVGAYYISALINNKPIHSKKFAVVNNATEANPDKVTIKIVLKTLTPVELKKLPLDQQKAAAILMVEEWEKVASSKIFSWCIDFNNFAIKLFQSASLSLTGETLKKIVNSQSNDFLKSVGSALVENFKSAGLVQMGLDKVQKIVNKILPFSVVGLILDSVFDAGFNKYMENVNAEIQASQEALQTALAKDIKSIHTTASGNVHHTAKEETKELSNTSDKALLSLVYTQYQKAIEKLGNFKFSFNLALPTGGLTGMPPEQQAAYLDELICMANQAQADLFPEDPNQIVYDVESVFHDLKQKFYAMDLNGDLLIPQWMKKLKGLNNKDLLSALQAAEYTQFFMGTITPKNLFGAKIDKQHALIPDWTKFAKYAGNCAANAGEYQAYLILQPQKDDLPEFEKADLELFVEYGNDSKKVFLQKIWLRLRVLKPRQRDEQVMENGVLVFKPVQPTIECKFDITPTKK